MAAIGGLAADQAVPVRPGRRRDVAVAQVRECLQHRGFDLARRGRVELRGRVALDQPDLVALRRHATLDELDRVDRDHRRRAPVDPRLRGLDHRGMRDPIEVGKGGGVGEDD